MAELRDSSEAGPSRLQDARAEFAVSLERRLASLSAALRELEQEPNSTVRRDQMRRRVHAVGAAARVLGFAAIAEALQQIESKLQRASADGELPDLARALEAIPRPSAGAGASGPSSEAPPEASVQTGSVPLCLLVFGGDTLARTIRAAHGGGLDLETVQEASPALERARAIAPDVIVVDAEVAGARDFVQQIKADRLLDESALLVIGEFSTREAAAEYAALGATRVLTKPASPEALHDSLIDVLVNRRTRIEEPELGELTVQDLTERIAREVRRGLVESLESGAEGRAVKLGAGTDVLAAVWGAVAQIRDVVTLRSGGAIRFARTGPEDAVPVAPWRVTEEAFGLRAADARGDAGISLERRRILVADDDPAVAWFVAGLLRAAGAEVVEAHDGRHARDLAFATWPDAVISDVLMPELDGFSLCRELKRDVALRDVPVILLSWKEDLLQRLREIGADANGYLRKEARASTIVQRVREVLRPRARVEQRLLQGGEVRGRLDGLTPRLILELACTLQPNCSLTVRDSLFLYEVQIREGRLRCATRTSADGSFDRGARVLAALLGVSAGRFVISPDDAACRSDFQGSLPELLEEPIRRARLAVHAFSEQQLMQVERIVFDEAATAAYARIDLEQMRGIVQKLVAGETPRALVLAGKAEPKLLESMLMDLARRGAVLNVAVAQAENRTAPEPVLPNFEAEERAKYSTETPPPAFSLQLSPAPPPSASEARAPQQMDLAEAVLGTLAQVSQSAPQAVAEDARRRSEERPSREKPQPEAGAAKPARAGEQAATSLANAKTTPPTRAFRADRKVAPAPKQPTKTGALTPLVIVLAIAALSFVLMRVTLSARRNEHPEDKAPAPPSATVSRVVPAPAQAGAPAAASQDLPLPPGALVSETKGLLEVNSPEKLAIYVDGAFMGRGPIRRVPLDPGVHQVELRDGARNRVLSVTIGKGRRTRLSIGANGKQAESSDSL